MQLLLHKDNIKNFVLVAKSFSGEYFKDYLVTEEHLFFNRFNQAFYDAMLLDLNANWQTAAEWVQAEYLTGVIVIFEGELWQAAATTCNKPSSVDWIKLSRFNTACYNDLWDNFLARILSGYVFKAAVPNINFKASPKGVTMSNGDSYDNVDLKVLDQWVKTFEAQVDRTVQAMLNYISRSVDPCFTALKTCLMCETVTDCGEIQRTRFNNIIAVGGSNKYGNVL